MKIKRNSEYFPRCVKCQRKYNKERARILRLAQKRELLLRNDQLEKQGWRICSNCFRRKELCEFSRRYGKVGKWHKMCDTCLSKVELNNRKDMSNFTPKYWRARAYACNTTFRNRMRRVSTDGKIVPLIELPYVIKPQDLIRIYNKQDGKCVYCNVVLSTTAMACDHSESISKGGVHHPRNIQLTCSDCNMLKHERNDKEFKTFLVTYTKRLMKVLDLEDKELPG